MLVLVLAFTHLHRGDTIITAAITIDLLTEAIGVEIKDECNLESIRPSLVIEWEMKQMKKAYTEYALVLMLIIGTTYANAEENASNPLAAVNNTDVRWQYFDLDGPEHNDFWLDGAYMLTPKLKLKYELHY